MHAVPTDVTDPGQRAELVDKAQSSKPPVQKLADRIAAVFVPVVLVIALMTGIGWYAWGASHHWEAARTWGSRVSPSTRM